MGRTKGKQSQQKAASRKSARNRPTADAQDEIELLMECFEEALSPAQLKAIEVAKAEHEKANDQIKEIRAGNTLVPSSQPNTFTIVPPAPKPQPPPPPPPQAPPKPMTMPTLQFQMKAQPVQAKPPALQSQPPILKPQQSLPQQPLPQQPLPQQIAQTLRAPAPPHNVMQPRTSPDVILISETPAPINKPANQTSLPQMIPAMPQQMYKMVPPGSQLAPMSQGQWVIRPLVTVSPQQMVAAAPPPRLPKSPVAATFKPPLQTPPANGVLGHTLVEIRALASRHVGRTSVTDYEWIDTRNSERLDHQEAPSRKVKEICSNRTCCTYQVMKNLRLITTRKLQSVKQKILEENLRQISLNIKCCLKQSNVLLRHMEKEIKKCKIMNSNISDKQSMLEKENNKPNATVITDLEDEKVLLKFSVTEKDLLTVCSSKPENVSKNRLLNTNVPLRSSHGSVEHKEESKTKQCERNVCDSNKLLGKISILNSIQLQLSMSKTEGETKCRQRTEILDSTSKMISVTAKDNVSKTDSDSFPCTGAFYGINNNAGCRNGNRLNMHRFSRTKSSESRNDSGEKISGTNEMEHNMKYVPDPISGCHNEVLFTEEMDNVCCSEGTKMWNSAIIDLTNLKISNTDLFCFKQLFKKPSRLRPLKLKRNFNTVFSKNEETNTDGSNKHIDMTHCDNMLYESLYQTETEIDEEQNGNTSENKNVKSKLKSKFWLKKVEYFYKQREVEVWTARSDVNGNSKSDKIENIPQGNRNTSSDPVLSQISNPEIMELSTEDNSNIAFGPENSTDNSLDDNVLTHSTNELRSDSVESSTSAESASGKTVRFPKPFHIPSFGDTLSFDTDDEQSNDGYQLASTSESCESKIQTETTRQSPLPVQCASNTPAVKLNSIEKTVNSPKTATTVKDKDLNSCFSVFDAEPSDRSILAKSYLEDNDNPDKSIDHNLLLRAKAFKGSNKQSRDNNIRTVSLRSESVENRKESKGKKKHDTTDFTGTDDDVIEYLSTECSSSVEICKKNASDITVSKTSNSLAQTPSCRTESTEHKRENSTSQTNRSVNELSVDETDSVSDMKYMTEPSVKTRGRNKSPTCLIENLKCSKANSVESAETFSKTGTFPDIISAEPESSDSESDDRLMIDCNYDSDHGNMNTEDNDHLKNVRDTEAISTASDLAGSQQGSFHIVNSRSDISVTDSVITTATGAFSKQGPQKSKESPLFQEHTANQQLEKCNIKLQDMTSSGSQGIKEKQNAVSLASVLAPKQTSVEKTSPVQDHCYTVPKQKGSKGNIKKIPIFDYESDWASFSAEPVAYEHADIQKFDGRNMVVDKAVSVVQKKAIFDTYMQCGIDEACKVHKIPVEKLREILKDYFETKLYEVEKKVNTRTASNALGNVKGDEDSKREDVFKRQTVCSNSEILELCDKNDNKTTENSVKHILSSHVSKTKSNTDGKPYDSEKQKLFVEVIRSDPLKSMDGSELTDLEINDDDFIIDKRGRRIYSYDFKKRVIAFADMFGDVAVAIHLNIDRKVIYKWRLSCSKFQINKTSAQMKKVAELNKDGNHITDRKMENKEELKRKRFRYSDNLKIKLVHMAKMCGVSNVVKQYGVKKTSLQLWHQIFADRKLESYELTEKDLLELVEGVEHSKSQGDKRFLKKSNPENTEQASPNKVSAGLVSYQNSDQNSSKENASQVNPSVSLIPCEKPDNFAENAFPSAIPVILGEPGTTKDTTKSSGKYLAVSSILHTALTKLPANKQSQGPPAAFIRGNNVVLRYGMPSTTVTSAASPFDITSKLPVANKAIIPVHQSLVSSMNQNSLLNPNTCIGKTTSCSSDTVAVSSKTVYPDKQLTPPQLILGEIRNLEKSNMEMQNVAATGTNAVKLSVHSASLNIPFIPVSSKTAFSDKQITPPQLIKGERRNFEKSNMETQNVSISGNSTVKSSVHSAPYIQPPALQQMKPNLAIPAPPALHKYGIIAPEVKTQQLCATAVENNESLFNSNTEKTPIFSGTSHAGTSQTFSHAKVAFSEGIQTAVASTQQTYLQPASKRTEVSGISGVTIHSNTSLACTQSETTAASDICVAHTPSSIDSWHTEASKVIPVSLNLATRSLRTVVKVVTAKTDTPRIVTAKVDTPRIVTLSGTIPGSKIIRIPKQNMSSSHTSLLTTAAYKHPVTTVAANATVCNPHIERQVTKPNVITPITTNSIPSIKQEPQDDHEYNQAVNVSVSTSVSGNLTSNDLFTSGVLARKLDVNVSASTSVYSKTTSNTTETSDQSANQTKYPAIAESLFAPIISEAVSKSCSTVYIFNRDGRITNICDINVSKGTAGNTDISSANAACASASQTTWTKKSKPILLKNSDKKVSVTKSPSKEGTYVSPKETAGNNPPRSDFMSEFRKQMGIEKQQTTANVAQREKEMQSPAESALTNTLDKAPQESQPVVTNDSQLKKALSPSKVSVDILYQLQLLEQLKKIRKPEMTDGTKLQSSKNRQQKPAESRIDALIRNVTGRVLTNNNITAFTENSKKQAKDNGSYEESYEASKFHQTQDDDLETDDSKLKLQKKDRRKISKDKYETDRTSFPEKYFAGENYFRFSHGLKRKLGVMANKQKMPVSALSKVYHIHEKSIIKWRNMFADTKLEDLTLTKYEQEEVRAHELWIKERKGSGKLKVTDKKDFQIYIDNPESSELEASQGAELLECNEGEIGRSQAADNHCLNSKNTTNDSEKNDNHIILQEKSREQQKQMPETQHSDCDVNPNIERQKELEQEISSCQRSLLKKNTARKSTTQGKFASRLKRASSDANSSAQRLSKDNVESEKMSIAPLSISASRFPGERMQGKRKPLKQPPSPVFDVPLYIEAQDPEITNEERNEIRKTWTSIFKDSDKGKGIFIEASNLLMDIVKEPVTSSALYEKDKNVADSPDVICLDDFVQDKLRISAILAESSKDKNVCRYSKDSKLYPISGDEKHSLEFKLKVVKEAQDCGCENVAKWYKLDFKDVKMWYDAIEEDKQLQFRLSVVKCAQSYGIKHASRLYSVAEQKISDWINQGNSVCLVLNETSGIFEEKNKEQREGLQFEKVQNGDVSIWRPKFETCLTSSDPTDTLQFGNDITSNNRLRTRMGGNSVNFSTKQNFSKAHEVRSNSSKELDKEYLADIEGDIGAMPRIVKQKSTKQTTIDGELEIASTWKQVQEYVKDSDKAKEKKYSPDFKAKIIKLCLQKGQKTVAREHKIPYNKISRWRLKAKNESLKSDQTDLTKDKSGNDSSLVIKINLKDEPKVMSPFSQAAEPVQPEKLEFSESFKKEVVGYARKHGFIAAAREYKIGNPRILSWIRYYRSYSFDSTESKSFDKAPVKESQSYTPNKIKSSRHSIGQIDTTQSTKSNKSGRKTPVYAENVHQDYIISKSSLGKDSALKITLSPRRKSPAPSKASSDEGSEIDDFEEVATWSADEADKHDSNIIELSDENDDVIEIKDTYINSSPTIGKDCIIINDDENDTEKSSIKDNEKTFVPVDKSQIEYEETVQNEAIEVESEHNETHLTSDLENISDRDLPESQSSPVKHISGNLYDLLETDDGSRKVYKPLKEPISTNQETKDKESEHASDADIKNFTSSKLVESKINASVGSDKQHKGELPKSVMEVDEEAQHIDRPKRNIKKELAVVLHDIKARESESIDTASKDNVQEELPQIPYEETLMYKVFSADMDDFFSGSFGVSKPLSEMGNKSGTSELADNLEKSENRIVKKRKRMRTADVEIMENLDEKYREYMFGPEILPDEDEFIHEGNLKENNWEDSSENQDNINEALIDEDKANVVTNDSEKDYVEVIQQGESKSAIQQGESKSIRQHAEEGGENLQESGLDAKVAHADFTADGTLQDKMEIDVQESTKIDNDEEDTNLKRDSSRDKCENIFAHFSVSQVVNEIGQQNKEKSDSENSNVENLPEKKEDDKIIQDRNLFDLITPASADANPAKVGNSNDLNTESKQEHDYSQSSSATENVRGSPLNLFGSLMKSIKLPTSLTLKSLGAESPTYQGKNQGESMENKDGTELEASSKLDKEKDKGNRNLFDFLSPPTCEASKLTKPGGLKSAADIVATEVSKNLSAPNLFENLKSSGVSLNNDKINEESSDTRLGSKASFVFPSLGNDIEKRKVEDTKPPPAPKSAFKFLSLPVNFGNIAKLGMAKLKESKSQTKETDLPFEKKAVVTLGNIEQEENTDEKIKSSSAEKNSLAAEDKTETEEYKAGGHDDEESFSENEDKTETEEYKAGGHDDKESFSENEDKTETEEYKTGRLDDKESSSGNENTLNSIETVNAEIDSKKPDDSAVDLEGEGKNVLNPESRVKERDNERNDSDNEEDDELYKSFAPQKVILILDISKKHGIEFASTSFGLPPWVIVNWIIEKDRKHRKVALTYTLEEKLTAVKQCQCSADEEVAVGLKTGVDTLRSWKEEVSWLLDSPGVIDCMQKWSKIENRTISLDDDSRLQPESLSANESVKLDQMNRPDERKVQQSAENPSTKHCSDVDTAQLEKIPDILNFAKTTHPKDFNIEQKAIVVLLLDKYGVAEVNKKLGISTKTLWGWKHRAIAARNYIRANSGPIPGGRKLSQTLEKKADKSFSPKASSNSVKSGTLGYTMKDTKRVKEEIVETVESKPLTRLASEKLATIEKQTEDMAKPSIGKSPLKGYRLISPTKIPEVLQDVKKLPTKAFTLEQRVAIVKLVDLYGVRTVHKQFRIPAGSIWNWQHTKAVMELARSEGVVEKTKRSLDFDEIEVSKSKLDTIETVMDRVKQTLKILNHLQFNSHQKADAVCLVNYYGIDSVFKSLKIIPRGTLWNWCHNKYVSRIVERKMELLQKADAAKSPVNKESENVAACPSDSFTDAVDKKDLTQKWLSLCHSATRKRSTDCSGLDSVVPDKKSCKEPITEKDVYDFGNFSDNSECSEHSDHHLYEEIDLDLGESMNSTSGEFNLSSSTFNMTPSIISSVSIHSGDYKEINSDDELSKSSRSRNSGQRQKILNDYMRENKKYRFSQSEASSVDVGRLEDLKEEIVEIPELEAVDFKTDKTNRMLVSFKVIGTKNVYLFSGEEVTAKPIEAAKKGFETPVSTASSPPVKKKTPPAKDKEPGEINSNGNWVPLDEYYYGTMDGDPNYEEEKGEFRFKCWYCSKMLYNNVRAMQHIQGHIDSSKQHNIDLSDLTQCKQCYKQFDTPFEMQTHMEKVHLSNKVLVCRICEKDSPSPRELTQHMRQNHHPCEMPYVCQLCNFRSSMYNDVVDHFKKKHDSSQHLLCLYCLRTFQVKFVTQGWGQTQTYYGHLLKHQSKSTTKKCVICRLTFFNSQDVKLHRKSHHVANHKGVLGIKDGKYQQQEQVMIKLSTGQTATKQKGQVKSLNVPASCKVLDIGGVVLPIAVSTSKCVECKTGMGSTDHYKKFIHCSMCRFATSCSIAYANHMMGFHSGQMSSLNLNIPWERPMSRPMYCACGFSSKYGNKIANHLAFCSKQTCYSTSQGSPPKDKSKESETGDESLLDVLGLMKRRSLTTRGKRSAAKEASGSRNSERGNSPPDIQDQVEAKRAKKEEEPVKEEKKKPSPKRRPKMGPKKRMAQIKAARESRNPGKEAEEKTETTEVDVQEQKSDTTMETSTSKDEDIKTTTDSQQLLKEASDDTDKSSEIKPDIKEDKKEIVNTMEHEEKSTDSENVDTQEQVSLTESDKSEKGTGDEIKKSEESVDSEKLADTRKDESKEKMEVSEDQTGEAEKGVGEHEEIGTASVEESKTEKDTVVSEDEDKEIENVNRDLDADDGKADSEVSNNKDMEKSDISLENMDADIQETESDLQNLTEEGEAVAAGTETVEDTSDTMVVTDIEEKSPDENMETDNNEIVSENKDKSEDIIAESETSHIPEHSENIETEVSSEETTDKHTDDVNMEEEACEIDETGDDDVQESTEVEGKTDLSESSAEKEVNAEDECEEKEAESGNQETADEDTSARKAGEAEETSEADVEKERSEEPAKGDDSSDFTPEENKLEPPPLNTQDENKTTEIEESAENTQEPSKESSTLEATDKDSKDSQPSAGRQSCHERSQERDHGRSSADKHGSHGDHGSHGSQERSQERDHGRQDDHSSHGDHAGHGDRHGDRHSRDHDRHHDRHGHDNRYRHDDRQRDGYQGGRSYDHHWDNRDRSHDRDYRGGDYRRDDRYRDNRNQGYNQQGYGRDQGGYNRSGGGFNRGGYNNRGGSNYRGGYNQNYRGGYRGGYY